MAFEKIKAHQAKMQAKNGYNWTEPGDSGGMMYIAAGRKDDASKIHKETAVAVQSLGDKTPIMLNGKPVGPFAVGVKLFPHKGFLEASYQAFEGNSVTF